MQCPRCSQSEPNANFYFEGFSQFNYLIELIHLINLSMYHKVLLLKAQSIYQSYLTGFCCKETNLNLLNCLNTVYKYCFEDCIKIVAFYLPNFNLQRQCWVTITRLSLPVITGLQPIDNTPQKHNFCHLLLLDFFSDLRMLSYQSWLS